MPIAVTAEQAAIADSVGQWARRADSIALVRGLEVRAGRTDWPAREWPGLVDLGVLAIAVPERLGGAGGSATYVAVVAGTSDKLRRRPKSARRRAGRLDGLRAR